MPVQVNGKVRARITVPADASEDGCASWRWPIRRCVPHLDGKTVRKVSSSPAASCVSVVRRLTNMTRRQTVRAAPSWSRPSWRCRAAAIRSPAADRFCRPTSRSSASRSSSTARRLQSREAVHPEGASASSSAAASTRSCRSDRRRRAADRRDLVDHDRRRRRSPRAAGVALRRSRVVAKIEFRDLQDRTRCSGRIRRCSSARSTTSQHRRTRRPERVLRPGHQRARAHRRRVRAHRRQRDPRGVLGRGRPLRIRACNGLHWPRHASTRLSASALASDARTCQLPPQAVRKQIAQGKPDPVYLILGDDEAEMSRLAADITALVEDELRAFNVERLYAGDKGVTPAAIVGVGAHAADDGRSPRRRRAARREDAQAEAPRQGGRRRVPRRTTTSRRATWMRSKLRAKPGAADDARARRGRHRRTRRLYKAILKHATVVECWGLKARQGRARLDLRQVARKAEALVQEGGRRGRDSRSIRPRRGWSPSAPASTSPAARRRRAADALRGGEAEDRPGGRAGGRQRRNGAGRLGGDQRDPARRRRRRRCASSRWRWRPAACPT